MLRPGGPPGGPDLVAAALEEALDDRRADGVERPCSCGGATTVLHAPAARASLSVTWATVPCRACASSSVPATVNAKSFRIRSRMPSPDGIRQLKQSPRSSICSAARAEPLAGERAIDDRRHPPAGDRVLAELEQALAHVPLRSRSGRHGARRAARGSRVRRADRLTEAGCRPAPRPGDGRARANTAAARATSSMDGAASTRPCSAAMDVETRPGMPHGSMRSKSARSTPTFRAMPW